MFHHSYHYIISILSQNQSFFLCLHTPPVIRLIHHAGHKGKDIVCAVIQPGHIAYGNLRHRINLAGAGAELGGVGDLVANRQHMDLAEVVCHAAVMRSIATLPFQMEVLEKCPALLPMPCCPSPDRPFLPDIATPPDVVFLTMSRFIWTRNKP